MPRFMFLLFIFSCACSSNHDQSLVTEHLINGQQRQVYQEGVVFADNCFDGARLNGFSKIDKTTFQATISPENMPINNSPWFAFRLWSTKDKSIDLKIAYTEHRHRFIPKMSNNGVDWEAMDASHYQIDTASSSVTLNLQLSTDTLWLAAQELMASKDIDDWADVIMEQHTFIQKEEVGKTVQARPIHLLKINENESINSLVIVGRQHPPEVPGGTIAMQAFVERILEKDSLATAFRDQFEILVFPLLNPDGVDMGNWRHNANGVDLNRDWQDFTQPETRAVRDWLKKPSDGIERHYSFGIDFHTSYNGPYLLVLDTIHSAPRPPLVDNWIKEMASSWPEELDIRPRAQDLPYCYNWFINELGAEAVTYEEGDEIDRVVIKKRAAAYATSLMKTLIK